MEGSVSLIDQHQAPARSRPSLALRQPTQIVILNGTPPPQDYSHASVTADTFLAVLAGNASGVPPPSRHSSGRVLQAGPQDKVFVYYRCVEAGRCGQCLLQCCKMACSACTRWQCGP